MGKIHDAVEENNLAEIKIELKKGVNIDAFDEEGDTPLYLACESGFLEIANFLFENGADINICNSKNYRAIDIASIEGNFEIIEWLIEVGAKIIPEEERYNPLELAVIYGNEPEIVRLLIKNGMDPTPREKRGKYYSCLHWANQENHFESLKAMVEMGADINFRNENGSTTLEQAAGQGNLKIVEFLIGVGADINCDETGNGNSSPLHMACAYGHLEVVKMLLKNGANPNLKSKDGKLPRDYASENGHENILRILAGYS